MSTSVVRILIVGPTTSSTNGMLKRLASAGWGSHSVGSVHEAQTVLKTIRFKIVLSAEKLPDGTGYELAALIGRQSGTLFIGVSLSETCLWLPVVERGVRSLGKRAMNPTAFESELGDMLRSLKVPPVSLKSDATLADATPDQSADPVRQPIFPAEEPLKANLVLSLVQDNSVLRTQEMPRSRPKLAIPPRRKFGEADARGVKRLQAVAPQEAKPETGTHGKLWRG